MPSISEIAFEVNKRSEGRPIGQLQQLRRELHGRDRVVTHHLFDSRTIFDEYAFHVGGRTELQFNIGFESLGDQEYLRDGVAFSLELNRNLRAIDPLVPKVARFNEFLRAYPDAFSDLRMWYYSAGRRSTNYPPAAIPPEIVCPGVFIFLGRLQLYARPDLDLLLNDFDRLLPLYRFVEGNETYPLISELAGGFRFSPGCTVKPFGTNASIEARQLDVLLRHNEIEVGVYNYLATVHGRECVATEQATGTGARMDVVVRFGERYWFYEIKTGASARACIRDALAQLLEYSYWPGVQEAERLIIVGEPSLDLEASAFLRLLRERFALPIYYQQFIMDTGRLIE